ncbi:hypothetical protein [Algiphilus sp.]|uniref:hypothetical protein n=1 Tax=Algiphilus sp. TaxID=1872431 RepID=UPI003B522B6B
MHPHLGLRPISAILAAVLLSACSQQTLYYSTQPLRLQDCAQGSQAEQHRCEADARATYAEHADATAPQPVADP